MGVQGAGKIIEFFRINKDEEIKKKLARRKKREKEKRQKLKESVTVDDVDMDLDEKELEIRASDAFTSFQIIRTDGKIRSFDFSLSEDTFKTGYAQVLVSLTNNMLALYKISLPSKKVLEPQLLYTVEIHGHRNDIRTLALSLDDELLCSASKSIILYIVLFYILLKNIYILVIFIFKILLKFGMFELQHVSELWNVDLHFVVLSYQEIDMSVL